MSSDVARLDQPGYAEVYRLDLPHGPAFVALHTVLGGHAFGGIRIRSYPGEGEALQDALDLARAMSRKVALTGLRGGGGKSVLMAPPDGEARTAAVGRLGAFIESLGGRYCCGPDLGFGEQDDRALRAATAHVACAGLGAATSRSVLLGIDALAPGAEVVAVQGLGSVGRPLAELLVERGVTVVGADPAPVEVPGVRRVDPGELLTVPCDVLVPCAAGGVLDGETIDGLRCGAVCSAANNPFATPDDPERLRSRGIRYLPDVLANAGATLVGASATLGESARVPERLEALSGLMAEVLRRAEEQGRSAHHVALDEADARIARMAAEESP